MNPIPILFTIPNFITAGSGRVMFNILTRLDKNRFSPYVCVSHRGGTIESELSDLGIPILELPFTIPIKPYGTFLWRANAAAKSFRPYGFKLWHSFHYTDDYSEPLIACLSGASAWIYTKKSMSWGSRAWLLRSFLASRIVADNDEMPEKFFNRIGLRNKTRVIHHGLPLDHFNMDIPARLNLRNRYAMPPDSVIVGCVAQLVPVKDHPNLIRAAVQTPQTYYLFAGSTTNPAYEKELIGLIDDLSVPDRIHLCGKVEDIPAFLKEIDIFVLPTRMEGRMEGCPVALLEAMASGKACIATDIPGSRDLIVHNESGLLVPPSDPQALAQAIQSFCTSPELRLRLGANARKRAEHFFSIEREVQAHEVLYTELIGIK